MSTPATAIDSGEGSNGRAEAVATGAPTWVTKTICALMVIIYATILIGGPAGRIAGALYQSAPGIWMGRYWALITSAFVHHELWHLALNVSAFWTIGRPVERAIGPMRMILLIISSAFVSSAAQLAVDGNSGVGYSGVAFAVFGFGWLAQKKYPTLRSTFSAKYAAFALTWLLGCIVLFRREVGNGAHVGGLVFGMVVAEAFSTRRSPRLAKTGAGALVIASMMVGMICPWWPAWWAALAYRAHLRGYYTLAAEFYQQSLEREPGQQWVLTNLAYVRTETGDLAGAKSAVETLRKIAPSKADEVERKLNASNARSVDP